MKELPTSCDGCQHAVDAGHPDDMIEFLCRGTFEGLPKAIQTSCNPCCSWVSTRGQPTLRRNFKHIIFKQEKLAAPETWSKWRTDE